MTARLRLVTVPDLKPDEWAEVPAGVEIVALYPAVRGPVVLRLNGEYLLRADWPARIGTDDSIEWFVDQPGDREDFRVILQIAAVVAAVVPGLQFAAPYLAAASIAYNFLVPPTVLRQPEDDKRSIYSASLSGNQARLDSPVWRVCGIDKINPPFAAQPYYEFDEKGDQFYYAVFAIGYGPHDILGEFIGKTPIGSFSDVLVHQYLAPGVQPSRALANVFSSSEVSGLELEVGRYVGGFIACQPGRTVKSIGYDVIAAQGLGKPITPDNDNPNVTVEWRVEYCPVNDAGAEIGPWRILDTQSRYMSTNTPQRWSGKRDLDVPCRPKVRMARTNEKATEDGARDGIDWAGMRAYLLDPAPLNSNVSHYEIVMRASQQLSAQSQTDFNVIAQGKCRVWNPVDGWNCAIGDWDSYLPSRSPSWWLAELWTDPVWGEGLPDERCDLQTLSDLHLVYDARQDRFDYTFTSRTDAWSAGQLIASAGRARMFRRYGVRTLARDELATLGKTAITPRTVVAGSSMPMQEKLPRSTDPDGLIIEYQSNLTWDTAEVECPCPGVTVMQRPEFQKYEGIKGRTHARREGLYHAADMALRQRTVSATTEMQALASAFLLPVRWQTHAISYAQTGDVAFWNLATLTMGLTEKADFTRGPVYLTLRRDDGSLTDPVRVLPGPTAWDVVLPAAPDFVLVLDDGLRERPVFMLGTEDDEELVKVSSITDGGQSSRGAQLYEINAVVDDVRVHLADNAFLPGPGDVQDPIGLPGDAPGGGTLILVDIARGWSLSSTNTAAANCLVDLHLTPIGGAAVTGAAILDGDARRWLRFPAEVGAQFEVLATLVSRTTSGTPDRGDVAPPFVHGDALDVWLNLGTERTWGVSLDAAAATVAGVYGVTTVLQIDIRDVATAVLQGTGTATFYCSYLSTGDGGGA